MTDATTPLSILDLVPVSDGSTPARALRNTIDLARRAEQLGYRRYWLAEHHFSPGVASSATAVLIGQVAAATSRIRVGAGAVQLGHHTAVSVVEQFGTLDGLYPGRIDLGLGRSGQRRADARPAPPPGPPAPPATAPAARVVDGLLIPAPFSIGSVLRLPRFGAQAKALQQPGARSPDFAEQVGDMFALLAGDFRVDGFEVRAIPGEGARVEVWILASSAGESARLAGARGLPLAANYHVTPSTVLETVEAYRAAFRPGLRDRPHVMVSADVVVAPDDQAARALAAPYAVWLRSIRTGQGVIPFPSPAQAAAHDWTDDDRALVADRVDTQFVGSPETVAERLRVLRDVTGADELLVTTITHDHADRVRSYELLAGCWGIQ